MGRVEDIKTAVRSYLPRWAAEAVLAQMKDAKQLEKLDQYKARVKRQHQARTAGLEALVAGYCTGRKYAAMLPCHRAAAVHQWMESAKKRGDITHVPSLKLCRRVVYRLAKAQKVG